MIRQLLATARNDARVAWIITAREVRDTLRDWRLVLPIGLLTLFFPLLMDATAQMSLSFTSRYGGAEILAWRIVPFLLMIVGFFPISFSLVIALETFVGEKERNSLEPLLAMPVSDRQLYLGKLLAAMIPPVLAAYLGITVYLIGLGITMHYTPPATLLIQILVLTTMQALVMVAGAVVVSSHTNSVRAANLLASFIVVPMALLVQGESYVMFWASYDVLWWIALGLLVAVILLMRLGLHLFNREEILSRGMDRIRLGDAWRTLKAQFLQPASAGGRPFSLWRVYGHDIPWLLRQAAPAVACIVPALMLAAFVGFYLADKFPLPAGVLDLSRISGQSFKQLPDLGFLPAFTTWGIFSNNVRSLLLAGVMALFSFGVLAILLLMAPVTILGYFAAAFAVSGHSLGQFVVGFILPHGIVELPAAILATALAARMGAVMVARPAGASLGQRLLQSVADFVKLFVFVVMPLLLLAAFLEANVTPRVLLWVYGLS